jgi:hypothetical protein
VNIEEAEAKRQSELEEVEGYCVGDILDNLDQGLRFTDVIVSGYQFAGEFSDAASIMFAGICKLRATVENAICWIQNQEDHEEEINDNATGDDTQL